MATSVQPFCALAFYVDNSFGARVARLERSLSPKVAIEAFFKEIIDRSVSDEDRKDCLLVNSALEVAPHDPDFCETVSEVLHRVEGFFGRCVSAGQQSGEIAETQCPDDVARMLLGIHLGIRVLARTRSERALLEGVARPAIELLRPVSDQRSR